ncbi:carboxypeptidase-like regulatory domain-containing protein [Sphingobacterium sp. E70]|uniref:carboxypeptidase-like regulatory domain-containing protein n=1 Tax=Sphingobacterium sp. E70 TaxID=2853439 RepID=UPI00211CF297|nr:carboxypeptidase-like regulatory domain-containing protein [Sphingobacterium sp. E70]ULT25226.1 carboxypeptidase-like regulatory domain-containing protein [Sphingobacterium sp. E70]
MTDAQGHYQLTNVPYGDHVLFISSLELHAKEISLRAYQKSQHVNIHVEMRSKNDLEEVKVERNSTKKKWRSVALRWPLSKQRKLHCAT